LRRGSQTKEAYMNNNTDDTTAGGLRQSDADGLREDHGTMHLVVAADEAYVREAIAGTQWERKGWLGRLVRVAA
jgi:hypothetical protein